MFHLQHSVAINRPVEEVFAFVTTEDNDPKWVKAMEESKMTSEGPTGVGSTGRQVSRFMGKRMEIDYVVTEWEPNRYWTMRTTKGASFPVQGTQSFEEIEGGTKITVDFQVETKGFFKLADPLIALMMKRQTRSDYARLKSLLESEKPEAVEG